MKKMTMDMSQYKYNIYFNPLPISDTDLLHLKNGVYKMQDCIGKIIPRTYPGKH